MTESDKQTTVSSKLADLRKRFLVRAEGDLQALEAQAESIREGTADRATLLDICARLHRLAGSAGTFGLPELGAAARSLEKMLRPEREADSGESARVPALAVEKLLALRTMLEGGPVPATEQSSWQPGDEVAGGSHGVPVTVLILAQDGLDGDYLEQGLAGYGFTCKMADGTEPGLSQALEQAAPGATVVLCPVSAAGKVAKRRDQHHLQSVRRLPIICVADDDTFETRYRVAETGADGFFSQPLDFPELAERIEYLAIERSTRVTGRVAMVEDDEELAEHYSLVLEAAGVEVLWIRDPVNLVAELSAFRPDILLMDVQLGGYSGVTLARLVRFDPRWLSLPIIYLSSEDDPDNQLEALSRGADEFLMKPVSDGYLVRSVLIRCLRARQLSRLMNLDSLTGLLKHSLIKQEVDKELARCRREGHNSTVVMVDLDHFKRVNDNYGHRCGDQVIKALANTLRNRLRETDMIGRYGGEEFMVVLPRCDSRAAAGLFTEIAESFAQLDFGCGGSTFRMTLSAGIATIGQFDTAGDAIEAADQALYRRKKAGRNGVTVSEA